MGGSIVGIFRNGSVEVDGRGVWLALTPVCLVLLPMGIDLPSVYLGFRQPHIFGALPALPRDEVLFGWDSSVIHPSMTVDSLNDVFGLTLDNFQRGDDLLSNLAWPVYSGIPFLDLVGSEGVVDAPLRGEAELVGGGGAV